jgi:nitronate monooxygenase
MNFGSNRVKPWKDIWGAGQGVGNIRDILPAAQVIERLGQEYRAASAQFAA